MSEKQKYSFSLNNVLRLIEAFKWEQFSILDLIRW